MYSLASGSWPRTLYTSTLVMKPDPITESMMPATSLNLSIVCGVWWGGFVSPSDTYTHLGLRYCTTKCKRKLTSLMPHAWVFPQGVKCGGGCCTCEMCVSLARLSASVSLRHPKAKRQTQNSKSKSWNRRPPRLRDSVSVRGGRCSCIRIIPRVLISHPFSHSFA